MCKGLECDQFSGSIERTDKEQKETNPPQTQNKHQTDQKKPNRAEQNREARQPRPNRAVMLRLRAGWVRPAPQPRRVHPE